MKPEEFRIIYLAKTLYSFIIITIAEIIEPYEYSKQNILCGSLKLFSITS